MMNIFRSAIFLSVIVVLSGSLFLLVDKGSDITLTPATLYTKAVDATTTVAAVFKPEPPRHIKTPEPLRAVYMSSWVAGSPDFRNKIIKMIDETELNAIVIDVKDSTGVVSFKMDDPIVAEINPFENRIPDVEKLITLLHDKDIYIIARIAVFEDPHLAKVRPDLAVKVRSTGKTWKDRKGLAWSDMGSKEVWDYNIAVARGAYAAGFDELNFDYIRFPSDGNMNDIMYLSLEGTSTQQSASKKFSKPEELRAFFNYLNDKLKEIGAPMSADLFGMTTTNTDDLNIGQVLENAIPYFDYISPMVYPSHYPNGFNGYKNPAAVPYELIKFVMAEGVKRMIAASSSPDKLRPWLQDFDMGATYTAEMVRAQIKATYDVGLSSWMLWDPSNKYTTDALEKN